MNKLPNNLYVFWNILKYFDQREIPLISLVSHSFYNAIYHSENPMWKILTIYTSTSSLKNWVLYFRWIAKIIKNAQPISFDISLTLSRISDESIPESSLQAEILFTLKMIFANISAISSIKEFKIYMDQHPLRQKILRMFLESLAKHSETLEKIRISQVALRNKHMVLLSSFKNLKSVDIGYCVCDKDIKLEIIGKNLLEFHCKDASNISTNQIVQVFINNPHIISLSFCGEDYNKDEILSIISRLEIIRKLVISHATSLNEDFFKILAKHAEKLEKLELTKVYEASNLCFGKLLSYPLPKLQVLVLNECEHLDNINIEFIAENCPSLIELCLEWAINIDDLGIQLILQKCLKLRILNLTGVKKISGKAFKSVLDISDKAKTAYQSLQKIDVSSCNSVQDAILREILVKYPWIVIRNYYGETNDFWNN